MAIAYELHATLPIGHTYLVSWHATEEAAQAALAEALQQGPWIEPAKIARIEVPDPIDFGPRVATSNFAEGAIEPIGEQNAKAE